MRSGRCATSAAGCSAETPSVCLFVRPENAPAIHLYEKIGMRRQGSYRSVLLMTVPERVEAFIRRHELIEPGGEVTCLVSGGADSTCLWHVLRSLGYRVSALHVNHGLRGAESEEDARFCREQLGAEVVDGRPGGAATEDALREIRYSFARDRLRATGHTASDQVETVLYRLAASGAAGGIKPKREDGVVRPLLDALARRDRGLLPRRGARTSARTRPTRTRSAG